MGAYLLLASLYSVTTPAFEAYDELWHYPYIEHLADGKGLPTQPDVDNYGWRQEGAQPPLYYALGTALTFWIDTGPPEKIYKRNPHANAGLPSATHSKNMVLHSPEENFPYQGVFLALHIARLFSVLLGAVTVASAYFIAWEVLSNRALATVTAALTAFNPTFLFVAGSVNNDNLINAVGAMTLLVSVRMLKGAPPRPLVLGLLLGGAALTKLSGLALSPLVGLVFAYRAWKNGNWGFWSRAFLTSFAVAGIVAGWWYWRNLQLYGDPSGLNAMLDVVGRRDAPPNLPEMEGVFLTYWGLFGGSNIIFPEYVYVALRVVAALALVGLPLALWKRKGDFAVHLPSLLLLFAWILVFLASLYRWSLLTYGSAGRLLYPAIGAFSTLMALGLLGLFPRRAYPWGQGSMVAFLLVLAVTTPFATILPAYRAPSLVGAEALERANATYINYGGKAELVGYELSTQEVRPGESLEMTLYLRAIEKMDNDYTLYIHLFGQDGERVAQLDSWPGSGAYPTSLWRPGTLLQDRYRLTVSPEAAAPSALWAEVGFYDPANWERLAPRDAQGREVSPRIARLKLASSQTPSYQPKETRKIIFGDSVELLGYDVAGEPLRPGGSMAVVLYWKALKSLDADYTVFVQLYQPGSRPTPWAQEDIQPHRGNYPTSLWSVEEVVRDEHNLSLPSEAPPGEYLLLAGLYRTDGRESLQVVGGERYAILDRIWVEP